MANSIPENILLRLCTDCAGLKRIAAKTGLFCDIGDPETPRGHDQLLDMRRDVQAGDLHWEGTFQLP